MSLDASRVQTRAEHRASHLKTFLDSRGLTVDELAADARARAGESEIFFVSTAVHGLSGSTSDIDLIVVTPSRLEDATPISTMAFVGRTRLGIKNYGREEVVQSLAYLANLSERTAGEIWQGVTPWRAPVPWVDLERVINGLRDDMTSPYGHALDDLCATRFSYSFELFREAIILGCLSRSAGEQRAPWGYLLHALPHLMDVALSCEGDTVTNVKWTTQRWAQSQAAKTPEWAIVNDWWDRAWSALHARSAPPEADEILGLYERGAALLGLSLPEDHDPLSWSDDLQTVPFSEGVRLTKSDTGRIVLHEDGDAGRQYGLHELCGLEPPVAKTMLAFMRADFAHARLNESHLARKGRALFAGQAK
jgi:hypothetical protein